MHFVEQTFDDSLTSRGDGDTVKNSILSVCVKCAVIVQTIEAWPFTAPDWFVLILIAMSRIQNITLLYYIEHVWHFITLMATFHTISFWNEHWAVYICRAHNPIDFKTHRLSLFFFIINAFKRPSGRIRI